MVKIYSKMFKRGQSVTYRTPRGAQEGAGKIVDLIQTLRGVWYEVKDRNTGAVVRLRASSLEPA